MGAGAGTLGESGSGSSRSTSDSGVQRSTEDREANRDPSSAACHQAAGLHTLGAALTGYASSAPASTSMAALSAPVSSTYAKRISFLPRPGVA
jgi:hypothetical protein